MKMKKIKWVGDMDRKMNDTELMNPKVDFVFKLLFGNEKDTSFLISFLNATLELSGEKTIKSVIIKNPVNGRQTEDDKMSIMDVKAETNVYRDGSCALMNCCIVL